MEKEEESVVSRKLAREHAISRVLLAILVRTPGLEKWTGFDVSATPLEIFDLNGTLLFYEYDVHNGEHVIGRVKVSANKVLGPAVWTVEMGERQWNLEKATSKAVKVAKRRAKSARIVSTTLVCYSFPKLGILVTLEDSDTKRRSAIVIDVASYALIEASLKDDEVEGNALWSVYGKIPHKARQDNIARWAEDDRLREIIAEESRKEGVDPARLRVDVLKKVIPIRFTSKRVILTLHGQEHCVWCADATGQMLLRFHNFCYTQNEIVTAMNTDWHANDCQGGTSNPDQVDGYEVLSHNYLEATYDSSPTWATAKSEIDGHRPLKSGISNHARACSGYETLLLNIHAIAGMSSRRHYLYIHDPWPVGADNAFCDPHGGTEYWEDWNALTHTNYIMLKPCAGTMVCQD